MAFFAVMYYAALRPAEAVGLKISAVEWPEEEGGWGKLILKETRPVAGRRWTNTGERHDRRGLKARPEKADRPVPIPPVLVSILRQHIKEFGVAKDGRLFTNERGGLVGPTAYSRVLREARLWAFTPHQVESKMGRRAYDFRSTCITRWLNAGVPIAEVARRAGNSPEVIHRRYQGCIDGHEEIANAQIERQLREEGDDAA